VDPHDADALGLPVRVTTGPGGEQGNKKNVREINREDNVRELVNSRWALPA
jgi:hypothetical protein